MNRFVANYFYLFSAPTCHHPPMRIPAQALVAAAGWLCLASSRADTFTGGLIVFGDAGETVLIRAIGPDLTALEVPNALQDPTLEVRDASGSLLASNDNWHDEQEEEITATGLAPNDDRDSAALCSLIPGRYTAIVRGAAESTGLALVEIYDLNPDH